MNVARGREQEQTADDGMKALAVLESSWSGDGADAAGGKSRDGVKVAMLSSKAYNANARTYADNTNALEAVKRQLTPMPDQAPERGAVDVLTPWDTGTDDQVNQYTAQLEQNRQAFQAYEQSAKSAQSNLRTGVVTFNEPGTGEQTGSPGGSVTAPPAGAGSVNVGHAAGRVGRERPTTHRATRRISRDRPQTTIPRRRRGIRACSTRLRHPT